MLAAKENNVLLSAAEHGHRETLALLIQAGADANSAYKYTKITTLMVAARYGHSKCYELLIEAGADVHAIDRKKGTALKHAVSGCRKNGLSAPNTLYFGPQLYPKCHRAAECIVLLVSAGADVNTHCGKSGILSVLILEKNCSRVCKCKERSVDQYSFLRFFLHAGTDLSGIFQRLQSPTGRTGAHVSCRSN